MRAIRVASAALLGVSALAFIALRPPARAATASGFRLQRPALDRRGGRAGDAARDATGDQGEATVSSAVFDTSPSAQGPAPRPRPTVDWDAKPGAVYEVTFDCGDV